MSFPSSSSASSSSFSSAPLALSPSQPAQHNQPGSGYQSRHPQPPPLPEPSALRLANVVGVFEASNAPLDLKAVFAELCRLNDRSCSWEYDPRHLPAVIVRKKDPVPTTAHVYTRKVVVTGAQSESDTRSAAMKYHALLRRLKKDKVGPIKQAFGFEIKNMIFRYDCRFSIRLEAMANSYANEAIVYEPEIFPALIWRVSFGLTVKIAVQIFPSGVIVLSGAKSHEAAQSAFAHVWPALNRFRKVTASV